MSEEWPSGVALPRVALRLELGKAAGVREDALLHLRAPLLEHVGTAISLCFEELGIPGLPVVELAITDLPEFVRVLLGGRYYVASRELLAAAWQKALAGDPQPTPSAPGFADWLHHGFAEDLALFLARGGDDALRGRRALGFLEETFTAILRSHPAELFRPEQADHLLARVARGVWALDPDVARCLGALAPSR